jgi:hypothetical protein
MHTVDTVVPSQRMILPILGSSKSNSKKKNKKIKNVR